MDEFVPLLEAHPGSEYVLARVHEEIERNPDLMAYLERHCLIPGAILSVLEVLPFNETVTLQCGGNQVVLGLSVARSLWVTESPANGQR